LDGAIVILDASKGVEAQTLKVWSQARKFGIPSIIYLNKMDKPSKTILFYCEMMEFNLEPNIRSSVMHGKMLEID